MELATQIKALRLQRGITQETLAASLGVTPQAVSKWERGVTLPEVDLLPHIAIFFGVTIDRLFAMSDEQAMARIQNMLYDVREFDPGQIAADRAFLLDKGRREPQNSRPFTLLADLENHLAHAHRRQAADYAREALRRQPDDNTACNELTDALGGRFWEWNFSNHAHLIRLFQELIEKNPETQSLRLWLLDQLLDAGRLDEAQQVLTEHALRDSGYRTALYRGKLLWHRGQKQEAYALWRQALRDDPHEWRLPNTIADHLALDGDLSQALEYYRLTWQTDKPPRCLNALESMAQIYELQGDLPAAIAVLQEELEAYHREHDYHQGESYAVVQREIARLQALLHHRKAVDD